MPGIFGFIIKSPEPKPERELEKTLDLMASYMTHRPTYLYEKTISNRLGLGAISIGRPFALKDIVVDGKDYLIAVDGYIYEVGDLQVENFRIPSTTVLERIVRCTSSHSSDTLSAIRGNYSLAVYDQEDKSLIIANDRIGPRRFYYADYPDVFVFASEMKGICFLPLFDKEIDWKGVADFLNFGYVLGDKTLFKKINSLSSSSVLSSRAENTWAPTVSKYWAPRYVEKEGRIEEFADEGLNLLKLSIQQKAIAGDNVISPLSGGLDSRIIAAILTGRGKDVGVQPVTYGQRSSYEYKNARKVCKALGLTGRQILVEIFPGALVDKYRHAVWLSEGMISMTNGLQLLIPARTGLDHDSIFNGIYGGPTNYSAEYYTERHVGGQFSFKEKVDDILKILGGGAVFDDRLIRTDLVGNMDDNAHKSISEEFARHLDTSDNFCNQRDAFFIENRMRRFICQSSLYRFFWEEQLPLSNYDLYDFYLATPPAYKLRRNLLKTMLIRGFPDLARIADANTGLNLYEQPTIAYEYRKKLKASLKYYVSRLSRGKLAFYDRSTYAHYDTWFKTDKATGIFFEKNLFTDAMTDLGLFDLGAVKALFTRVHEGGPGFDHLVRIITFSIWYEMFVLGQRPDDIKSH
ncbi:MAG: Asparagine synthetase (glutamine-hydrolyzing) 3 [Syntrophorhabdus sp. PtaU1.Bin002]|nr:MAG: Asparagine synthetase (glutamine-hydrolyzing) 3 [Syntrophorhabdus sp. PtaB.Bin006]OPY70065.1 MAG: Asparagine synthetase (glutamine-hydrolyzing) 3 [Syntrophorhabdus sp. PtaU1.Bin002]